MSIWKIHALEKIAHLPAWDRQENIRKEIIEGKDEKHLFLVEHPPTLTLGRGEKGQNLHQNAQWYKQQGFDIVEVNRGGEVTYHGPGQLVAYPVFHLQNSRLGIRDYICLLEKVMLETISYYGLEGHRKEGHPGIYVQDKKIGSVGIHVRKFVTIHGLALNVRTNLDHFHAFTPCGIKDIQMTSLVNEGVEVTLEEASQVFKDIFLDIFSS